MIFKNHLSSKYLSDLKSGIFDKIEGKMKIKSKEKNYFLNPFSNDFNRAIKGCKVGFK